VGAPARRNSQLRKLINTVGYAQGWQAADHPAKPERDNRQAMSNQNLQNEELARFAYDWFNREKEPPPIWLPDGEFINAGEDPGHATYRGIDAMRKQHQGWFDAYPDVHLEPLEIRSNGDRVFVCVRFTGHGAESGAAMEMELAHVTTLERQDKTSAGVLRPRRRPRSRGACGVGARRSRPWSEG